MSEHIVAAVLVQTITEDGAEMFLSKGAVVPATVPEDEVARLAEIGHVVEAESVHGVWVPVEASTPPAIVELVGGSVEYPEGDPTERWTIKQIDSWGADQVPPLLFSSDQSKAERLTAIADLRDARD